MKYTFNLLILMVSLIPLMTTACELHLAGKWKLNFEYYLDSISEGDPDVKQRLSDIWDGQPFIKISLDDTKGKYAQKWAGGWSSFNFDYRISPGESDSCEFTFTAYTGNEEITTEAMKIWVTPEGFCQRPLVNAKITDCYLKDGEQ
ncbi:hypothetical protein HBA55_19110 [Pseudomaricurvus alkylphenolicus]|uniref:hypothetical protein n=1 Tax=Pseudomaricurvus alkylphenolicus TaxID=1306991 RepID=UPI001422EFBA|nr:hypothetical protein [Pseudomaricurvus alkylphenolicus]NIB41723.1 hypothetical protein [Pseudomaricurvus alkylphenolicus]